MRALSFVLAASLLLIAACDGTGKPEKLKIDQGVSQVIFFSDDTNYTHEAAYYDAIIELKRDFPEEMDNMMVLTGDEAADYHQQFNVTSHPAILVFFQEQVVAKVDGIATKEQIVLPLSKALSIHHSAETH